MKTCVALVVLAGSLFFARVGSALELADPDGEFAVTVPSDLAVCVILPKSGRDAKACALVDEQQLDARKPVGIHTMAVVDAGEWSLPFSLSKQPPVSVGPMSPADWQRLGEALLKAARAHGASLVGVKGGATYDLVRFGQVPAIGTIFTIGESRILNYTIQGEHGLYIAAFYSDAEHRDEACQLAERILSGVRVKLPVSSETKIGGSLAKALMTIVLLVVVILVRRRREASAAAQ